MLGKREMVQIMMRIRLIKGTETTWILVDAEPHSWRRCRKLSRKKWLFQRIQKSWTKSKL